MIRTQLDQLLIGTPKAFGENGEASAIAKDTVDGPLMLRFEGLAGNQVADPVHHGGPDKAVHLYPFEHYAFWQKKYPDVAVLDHPGAFGENFSCSGLTEEQLCLGDVFRVGEALIECSHARQPCWKLNHRFGSNGCSRCLSAASTRGRVQSSLRYRIILRSAKPGVFGPDNWQRTKLLIHDPVLAGANAIWSPGDHRLP